MDKLRAVVLVSSDLSDIYFANQMLKKLNVVGVVVEEIDNINNTHFLNVISKIFKYSLTPWRIFERIFENIIFKKYNILANQSCCDHFGSESEKILYQSDDFQIITTVGKNSINSPAVVEKVRNLKPDIFVICGCSILKKDLLSIPSHGSLNLHGGLSQKYRGIWTTMWAVHNEEPEYVGATVHYVSSGIDDGDIIYQGRPEVTKEDNSETLYAKVVKLGVEMMLDAVQNIQNGIVNRFPLHEKGQLYLGKMVTATVLKKTMVNIDNGLLARYLREKEQRDEKVIRMMQGHYPPCG